METPEQAVVRTLTSRVRTLTKGVCTLTGSVRALTSSGTHADSGGPAVQCRMITRGIRELVARDWASVRESKEVYWGERIGRLGAGEGLRVAEELRLQMRQRDPAWPDADARAADLRFHIAMAERLRRAGAARRR